MDGWRQVEELDRMKQWDADAVCDALNISAEELVDKFLDRAVTWVEANCE